MKNKATATIIISIVAVVGGMALNFQEFLVGSPATVKNLIVTFTYIVIWILVLRIGVKNKNRGIIMYCSVFWIITLFLSILTAYINATGTSADWALPFVVLLLGQWYGISFFAGSFLNASIIMAIISLVIFTTVIISLNRIRDR